jgi:hypothetical protein
MAKEFQFDLIFALPRDDLNKDAVVDALYEAGCDDALIGLGNPGQVALSFTRRAKTRAKAIESATQAVLGALPAHTKLLTVDNAP